MKRDIATRMRSRPVSTTAVAVCGLCLAWYVSWQCAIWMQWSEFAIASWVTSGVGNVAAGGPTPARAGLEALETLDGNTLANAKSVSSTLPFNYRGRRFVLRIAVPAGELALARALPTERVFASRGRLRAAYVRAMVAAAQSDPVVSEACRQLRAVRDALGLESDEYAELITRFVQQVPYGPVRPRFAVPAAALTDGRAVCADKSVLLASLLVHEGYGAAVIAIDASHHAAAAVRGLGPGFLGSGYAYIETTADTFLGEVPPSSDGRGVAGARTQIVPVGRGRAYGSDLQSQFLGESRIKAGLMAINLEPYREYARTATGDAKEAFAGLVQERSRAIHLEEELASATDRPSATFERLTRSGGR